MFEYWSGQLYFDLPGLLRLSGEERATTLKQLNRWTSSNKIIRLKRGYYTISPKYRSNPISICKIANIIYSPSYLSSVWALGYYGMIPEKVPTYTSVTTRTTRGFNNTLGVFKFHHLDQKLFNGFSNVTIEGEQCWLAKPEKALLDFLYLHPGVWNAERIDELRLQNFNIMQAKVLKEWAVRYPKRIQDAVHVIQNRVTDLDDGMEL